MVRSRYVPDPAGSTQVSGARLRVPACGDHAGRPAEPATDDESRDDDPRIGVSRMSRLYCAALSSVALAGLANGVGIGLSPGRYSVMFDNDAPSLVSIGPEYTGREVLRCSARRPPAASLPGRVG
jgi:hypothetical protein